MSDLHQQIRARAPVDGSGPTDQVGTPAEEDEDVTVPIGSGLKAAVDTPSACRARFQGGGRRGDAVSMFAILPGGLPACRPSVGIAHQCFPGQVRPIRWDVADVDCPEGTAYRREILRVADFLVAKKLCPGAIWRVT